MNILRCFDKCCFLFVFAVVCLQACEEPEDGRDGVDGEAAHALLFNTMSESAGANCAEGGVKVEVGSDVNDNGSLDGGEIQKTFFVCNGADGADGVDAEPIKVRAVIEPAGDRCQQGGTKILVGRDLNRDGVLNNDEVEDESYICHGETDAAPLGKSHVVISGNMTNEEAQALVDRDGGVNTQFIWILNTRNLTTLDLSGFSALVELRIENNAKLEAVSVPDLELIQSQIYAHSNFLLPEINFPKLTTASSINLLDVRLVDLSALQTIGSLSLVGIESETLSLPNLTDGDFLLWGMNLKVVKLEGLRTGSIEVSSTQLATLDLPLFEQGSVNIQGTSLETLTLPSLHTGSLSIVGSQLLTVVNAPVLERAPIIDISSNPLLQNIQMPALKTLGHGSFSGAALNILGISNVESAHRLSIVETDLQELNLPSLATVSCLEIRINGRLNSVNLDGLTSISETCGVYLHSNALTTVQVNYLLGLLANLEPGLASDNTIDLRQSGSSVPSGQGLIDLAALRADGISVFVDE